jgi:hypothetical protein
MARPKGSKNKTAEPSQEPQESEPPKPEHMTLYLVNYWVPFPSSEYGGLQAVVASDDEECYKLIAEADAWEIKYQKNSEELIRARIKKATRFQLVGGYLPEMVRSFTT